MVGEDDDESGQDDDESLVAVTKKSNPQLESEPKRLETSSKSHDGDSETPLEQGERIVEVSADWGMTEEVATQLAKDETQSESGAEGDK